MDLMQAPCVGFVLFRIDENLFQLFWFLHNPPNKDTFQSFFLFKVILTQPLFFQICWGGRRSSMGRWQEVKEHWSHHASSLCLSLCPFQLHILALVPVSWIYFWPYWAVTGLCSFSLSPFISFSNAYICPCACVLNIFLTILRIDRTYPCLNRFQCYGLDT